MSIIPLLSGPAIAILTRAGAEIGVAPTKAFTTQLAALMLLTGKLVGVKGQARC